MRHTILFTGHMIDAKDREATRFPPEKEMSAREEIKKALVLERKTDRKELKGLAGAAAGGDILFHEVCSEMNIPTEVFLAMPENEFKRTSVAFAGKDWETRFDKLIRTLPVQILTAEKDNRPGIWDRANTWMLNEALKAGRENMTLIALWDGNAGDDEGGTQHMVQLAKQQDVETKIIEIKKL